MTKPVDRDEAERLLTQHEDNASAYYAAPAETENDYLAAYMATRAAVLAAMTRSVTVPEGWKLVPVEPTEAMIEASDAVHDAERDRLRHYGTPVTQASWKATHERAWSAMLAAAPEVQR